MTPFEQITERVRQNIEQYGQHVQGVGGGGGIRVSPPFAYTIGNSARGLPELLFIGPFDFRLGTMILNAVAKHMWEKGRIEPGMLDLEWTFPFKLREAGGDVRDTFTIQAGQFYGHENYTVMQVMICDKAGRYPGDPGCDPAFDVAQP